ncbi:branched-chain amino acid aminotransferase [Arthrobacter sp. GAS37]|uniref:branched-chain-amino-acid transaminase n=1 Tax=Arthrobacter sp. GAS37 TaxID=3156261 RepID=UPI0038388865
MSTVSWIDGCLAAEPLHEISLWNHSLHYGYGVFEGIRSYDVGGEAHVFRLEEHIERLWTSCREIGLEPNVTPEAITDAVHQVLQANDFVEAYIRPIVYLGEGLGTLRDSRPIHTAVLAWQWDAKDENGRAFKLGISRYRRPDPESYPAFAKATGNYLLSKTATLWAAQNGYDDAVLLDHEGFVSEASAQNLFMVSAGNLITPPENRCLKGITRATIIQLALSEGFAVQERNIDPAELLGADEIFLTSTASEVLPVESVNGQRTRRAEDRPVTNLVAQRYKNLVVSHPAPSRSN